MTGQQQDLFTADGRPLARVDRQLAPEERQRLSRQCAAILQRLEQGPATNAELAEIALKYTGRLSELRQAGYRIAIVERERKTGRVVYGLER